MFINCRKRVSDNKPKLTVTLFCQMFKNFILIYNKHNQPVLHYAFFPHFNFCTVVTNFLVRPKRWTVKEGMIYNPQNLQFLRVWISHSRLNTFFILNLNYHFFFFSIYSWKKKLPKVEIDTKWNKRKAKTKRKGKKKNMQ